MALSGKEREAPSAIETDAAAEMITTPRIGFIAALGSGGEALVDFDGNSRGPIAARSTVPLESSRLLEAVATRRQVVLLFENGDSALPLIVGLLEPPAARTMLDMVLDPAPAAANESAPVEAIVDGQRVVLEAKDEIVLSCGEASITLRRNGKIVIRGVYVETHAAGLNRIKGAAVRIN